MRLQLSREELVKLVIPSFHDCMIPSTNADHYNTAIFIPPTGHLLFTFHPTQEQEEESESVLVNIVTDSWQLLLHVNDMFERIISSAKT